MTQYNSHLTLNDYEYGTPYEFRIRAANAAVLPFASADQIIEYSDALEETEFPDPRADGRYKAVVSAVGVIVDKHKKESEKDIDTVTAMFKRRDGKYILNRYAANQPEKSQSAPTPADEIKED